MDTHGHLFLLEDEPSAVLDRASASGVEWLVCPGVDVDSSERSRDISEAHPDRVLWTAGLHPHEASTWPSVEERIGELAADAAAVGECGLDWYRELSPREDQRRAFSAQVALAGTLDKPLIVHCRDAFSDVYEILEDAALGSNAVLHCWTGGPKWTKRFRELGVVFSFAGPLTYRTGDTLRLGAAQAPPEQTMVETDAPYLTPEPLRGTSNEPANVGITGSMLAEVWGIDIASVARTTTENATRVFGGPRG